MINLNAYILIQGIDYGQVQLKANPYQTLQKLKHRLIKSIRVIEVKICYEEYELPNDSKTIELFGNGDSIIIKIKITDIRIQLKQQSIITNCKRDCRQLDQIKRKKKSKNQKKKIKKVANSQKIITKSPLLTKSKQTKSNKFLSATQRTFNKIIQFIDNYLIFSKLHRHRQYSILSDVRKYFVLKYGCSLDIQTINQIVSICPSLYQIKNFKNHNALIKLKMSNSQSSQVNIKQRVCLFNKCLLQFQNTQIQNIPQKINIVSKIIQPSKKAIDPKSIFYDKNFSQNLKRIIKQKEQMIEQQKNKNTKPELIKQYLTIIEQIQLLKSVTRINPSKQKLYQEILKRIQSSITVLDNFILFMRQRSDYIETVVVNGFCKFIINSDLFVGAKKIIQNM